MSSIASNAPPPEREPKFPPGTRVVVFLPNRSPVFGVVERITFRYNDYFYYIKTQSVLGHFIQIRAGESKLAHPPAQKRIVLRKSATADSSTSLPMDEEAKRTVRLQ